MLLAGRRKFSRYSKFALPTTQLGIESEAIIEQSHKALLGFMGADYAMPSPFAY